MSKRALIRTSMIALTLIFGLLSMSATTAKDDDDDDDEKKDQSGERCAYDLTPVGLDQAKGEATVRIRRGRLQVRIEDAQPNTLYTVWVDHRNGSSGLLAPDYPDSAANPGLDLSFSGEGAERGVAPAFATVAGVTSGMGIDPNGMLTNRRGRARLNLRLDYNLLQQGASPVVAENLVTQGGNIVGGGWLRLYEGPIAAGPSLQRVGADGLPILARSTAQGITIVRHTSKVTHGHWPGVGDVNHFPAFKGDFPSECVA